jgi:flagellar motor switch protein FliM
MAGDFLSQDEVDALLKGVTGETDEPEDPTGRRRHPRYNLGTQERIVRGRMPTLELVNERFARYLRIGLFNYMHRNAEISVGPIRVQKYSEFIRNLVVPTNLNLVAGQAVARHGAVRLRPQPGLSGGRQHVRRRRPLPHPGRGARLHADRATHHPGPAQCRFTEYSKSWKPVYDITFEYIRSEMNSQFANIATPSEIVVSTTFTLEFGGATADMHICFPYSMVEPIRDLLYSTMQSDQLSTDKRWISHLAQAVARTPKWKSWRISGNGKVTLGQILKLKVGDVIPINIPENRRHGRQRAADGMFYGQQNGQYALKVERFIASPAT